MKKRKIALKGKIAYCTVPVILLLTALYLFTTAAVPVSSGGERKAQSFFEIIEQLTEG